MTFSIQYDLPIPNANLPKVTGVAQGNSQYLYTDFPSAVVPLPYISKATECDRRFTDSGEIAAYDV